MTMEPQEWDRIADLLIQIRKKLDNILPTTDLGDKNRIMALALINNLLLYVDELAEIDGKGWL